MWGNSRTRSIPVYKRTPLITQLLNKMWTRHNSFRISTKKQCKHIKVSVSRRFCKRPSRFFHLRLVSQELLTYHTFSLITIAIYLILMLGLLIYLGWRVSDEEIAKREDAKVRLLAQSPLAFELREQMISKHGSPHTRYVKTSGSRVGSA